MFHEPPKEFALPILTDNPIDDMYDEMEILGFPLRNPFDLVNDDFSKYPPAKEIGHYIGKQITVLAYYITYKVVPTKNNTTMSFGTFIDSNFDWLDTVHFPNALQKYPLQGKGFYRITGKVVEDFNVFAIEVSHMVKVGYKERKYTNL